MPEMGASDASIDHGSALNHFAPEARYVKHAPPPPGFRSARAGFARCTTAIPSTSTPFAFRLPR